MFSSLPGIPPTLSIPIISLSVTISLPVIDIFYTHTHAYTQIEVSIHTYI